MKGEGEIEFEEAVKRLQRRELPARWRSEILGAALREEEQAVSTAWWIPPRWLGIGLAASWALIVVINLIAPPDLRSPHEEFAGEVFEKRMTERRQLFAGTVEEGNENGGRR